MREIQCPDQNKHLLVVQIEVECEPVIQHNFQPHLPNDSFGRETHLQQLVIIITAHRHKNSHKKSLFLFQIFLHSISTCFFFYDK